MRELIIGGDGFIGAALCRHLPDAMRTTRRMVPVDGVKVFHFDLLKPSSLPDADIIYICAGVNGTLTCADDLGPRLSWKTNVDGTIWVMDYFKPLLQTANEAPRFPCWVVWISSTTVMWLNEHYGTQKRHTELYAIQQPHVSIVRAGRVLKDNIDDLCKTLIHVGRNRIKGITTWNEDERPYQH